MNILLLICLLFSHYICDYSHLSRPYMLKAKAIGSPIEPILGHALYHMIGMGLILIVFGYGAGCFNYSVFVPVALIVEFITHFFIDLLKGKCNVWFPQIRNTTRYPHWYVFGLDQLLHQVVIVLIWWMVVSA